jgi:hypothetical protein
MISLSVLVKLRNDFLGIIKDLSLDHLIQDKIQIINSIKVKNNLPEYYNLIDASLKDYESLTDQGNNNISNIKKHVDQIEKDIDRLAEDLTNSQDYQERFTENKIKAGLSVDGIESILQNTISGYCDWRYPAMHFCEYVADGDWRLTSNLQKLADPKLRIDYMVAGDPLYLVDRNLTRIREVINSMYSEIYQKRLRLYDANKEMHLLPQGQFGFILCWDFLNYLPSNVLLNYVKQMFSLLREGGTLMFTYNNCDLEKSAESAEKFEATWVTKRFLTSTLIDIGFESINFKDIETEDVHKTMVSWVEAKKSGELKTIRLHQSLGVVVPK